MKPFNIKIKYGENEVTLTILPTKEGYFKVIYYGGILGAIKQVKKTHAWELVSFHKITAGDLPLYETDELEDRLEIELNKETVAQIGNEIMLFLDKNG